MALKTDSKKRRYNSYSKKQNRGLYHFPGNKVIKKSYNKNRNKGCLYSIDLRRFFVISDEVEREYKVYKLKKDNKLKSQYRNYSLYEDDGSVDYIRVLKSLFSNYETIRVKAFNIFIYNIKGFFEDDMVIDWIVLIFSCIVLIYILLSVFINVPSILEYKLNIII